MQINIPFKVLTLTFLLVFTEGHSCHADFTVDLEQDIVYQTLQIYTLNDLGVGETAYIGQSTICVNEKGNILLPKDTKLIDVRSEYMSYLKAKRLPGEKLSLELIPSKSESKSHEILDFMKSIVNRRESINCDLAYRFFGYSREKMLSVESIEGVNSLRLLVEKL